MSAGPSSTRRLALIVVAVTFVALLVSAGVRAVPGVLILPLERSFGWSRDTISAAAALGIFLYGMTGPFAAALMNRFGVRRTMLCALALLSASAALSAFMTAPWQLMATWGLMSGIGTGCVAVVLGATIANRWFVSHRGLVMGILTASTATGTLVFLPLLAALVEHGGWRPVVWTIAIATALVIPLVWWLLPESPQAAGVLPYGADPAAPPAPPMPQQGLLAATFGSLAQATRVPAFWYLFATFFVCGLTTNGLVGTHLIAMCGDRGIGEVQAAGLLAAMGVFDLVGTTLSGWLTDRYDPRKLLFAYYAIRGVSLIYLPYSDFSLYSLSIFAVFYGLDWIATVPPTLRLTTDAFGERIAPIVFGWIAAGHQIGAATAAYLGGWLRQTQGDYLLAFVFAGTTGLIAAVMALMISRTRALAST